jgi:2-isopropylmalate synthase
MENYIRIFDTTLRDGEQSPGASMTSVEKLEVVRRISIEVGNPPKFEEGLNRVPTICSLARATRGDIDKAWEAVKPASHPRIHTFIATSDIHMQYKLKMTREQVLRRVAEMTAYARGYCPDVEFSPEDAGRSDPQFLYTVLSAAIQAGATTLNIPDTVGYTTPDEFRALITGILQNTPGIQNCVVSVHCHDDLGLSTANTLAGILAGARQVEVTVNGIGERAGNTSLEEVVMTLHTRRPAFKLETGINTTHLMRVSKLVSNYTGIVVQPNKAVVGANAFAHEAGIHQDGMLKHNLTYEIMRPETVGVTHTRLVLGKHSGRHALKTRLYELGYPLSEPDLDKAFERFKNLADKKKTISDADLEALVADEFYQPREVFTLDGLQVACGTMGMPTATVRLKGPDGRLQTQAAIGTGPVDAVYKAMDNIIQASNTLLEFSVHAVTEGIDALGEVTVRIQSKEAAHTMDAQKEVEQPRTFGGHGADTDIIVASAKAYLAALNKLLLFTSQYAVVENPSIQNIPMPA